MNEFNLLNEIFGEKYKNKYSVGWCDMCNKAHIKCPTCKNTSCNGCGCEECSKDSIEFSNNVETRVESYLNEEELKVFKKTEYLKRFIVNSIQHNEMSINFKRLKEEGELTLEAEELFRDKIS